jgi:hypothetical protein
MNALSIITGGILSSSSSGGGGGETVYVPQPTGRLRGRVGAEGLFAGAVFEFTPPELDLTLAGQDAAGLPRLVPGNRVRWRLSFRDADDAAIDCTGARAIFTLRRTAVDGELELSREVTFDADQATEDEDAHTGRSWGELPFDPEEETELLGAAGRSEFDITLELADGGRYLWATGEVDVAYNVTQGTQFD